MTDFDNTSRSSQTRPTVAIIDPDESMCNRLERLLESDNLGAAIYASAEDFLAELDQKNYALLIIETNLPGISGLELLERLGKLDYSIPAIMLSLQNDVSLAVRAIRAGAIDFIEKPLIQTVLMDRIRRVLSVRTHSDSFKPGV